MYPAAPSITGSHASSKRPKAMAVTPDGDASAEEQDSETIFAETGHLPDRDQMFDNGQKIFPLSLTPPTGEQWAEDENDGNEDIEQQIVGDRSLPGDALDELERTMREGLPPYQTDPVEDDPTPVARRDDGDLETMSLRDLERQSAALGIAGRVEMSRLRLIEAIRAAMAR